MRTSMKSFLFLACVNIAACVRLGADSAQEQDQQKSASASKTGEQSDCGEQSESWDASLSSWLKKNFLKKVFGYEARCEFWVKIGLRFWIWVGYVDFLAKFGAKLSFRV